VNQAIIIANGNIIKPVDLSPHLTPSTLIIAADGGIHNCKGLGIYPHVIIGDLDSVDSDEITTYRESGVDIIQYPTRKDETDLELALHYILKREINGVIILGGLGARWDMTIASILLLANPIFNQLNIHLLDGEQEILLLKAGICSTIQGHPGDTVSLLPLTGDVSGVLTQGLEYPLHDETLQLGNARGVSNVLLSEQAKIFYKQGNLLCIMYRKK
jgi:thiamine pyrophosphokinase